MDAASYERLKPLGIYEEAPTFQLTPEKVRVAKTWIEMRVAANSLSICQFPPWRFMEYVELLNAVTGWGASMHELVLAAQRTLNLARVFNVREGFKASDDWLPSRFFRDEDRRELVIDLPVPALEVHGVRRTTQRGYRLGSIDA